MKFEDFKDYMIIFKNSVAPEVQLNDKTIKFWYEKYFWCYEKEQFDKIIQELIKNKVKPIFSDIETTIKEYYGFLLYEEVEKSLKIMEQAEKEGIKVSEKRYPKLKNNYSLPIAESWEIAFNKKYRRD